MRTVHGHPTVIKNKGRKFFLQLLTKSFMFYCDPMEGDENANTIMKTRKGRLCSDNYFASNELAEYMYGDGEEKIVWESRFFTENAKLQSEYNN